MPVRGWLAVVLIVVSAATPLSAKGSTARLTIVGGRLHRAVDVSDRQLLAQSNVYDGAFIGAATATPPAALPRYELSFEVESPAWMNQAPRVRYVVRYAIDPATGGGFIYLPSRGEPGHAINNSTIERPGEGQWHRASPAWASALNPYILREFQ